jgi:hypothetical protein
VSALLYGALTAKRETTLGDTTSDVAPGFKTYVDALAALVPAEVLAAALALTPLSSNSTRAEGGTSEATVNVTSHSDLKLTFYILFFLGPILYLIGHTKGLRTRSTLSWSDLARMFIPAFAFIGWMAAQHPSTLFDAAVSISDAKKAIFIVVGSIVLGALAARLGIRADQQNPASQKRILGGADSS